MASVQSRLLPCPFCRSPKIGIQRRGPVHIDVWCTECGAKKSVISRYLEQALHEWNMREGVLWVLKDTELPQERRHPYRTVKD